MNSLGSFGVVKVSGQTVQVSREVLVDAAEMQQSLDRYLAMTPAEHRARAHAARQDRESVRAAAATVGVSVERLIDGLGWSTAYAEHFVQSYCECGEGSDGWETCAHADDLGLTP